jgi:hypothetical protein
MEEENGFQIYNEGAAPERAVQALVTQNELPPPTQM